MASLLTKTLSNVHPKLRTNGIGIGNNHRRISLGFDLIARNSSNPLVRKYLNKRVKRRGLHLDEQGSYHSLDEDFGSSYREVPVLGDIDEVVGDEALEDGGSVSRTISLPSRISEASAERDVDWLLEEHERRYSTSQNSQNEHNDIESGLDTIERIEYDDFMNRVRQQLQQEFSPTKRRGSFLSVSTRGSVPQVFQSLEERNAEDFEHEEVNFRSESLILLSYSIPLVIAFFLEQMFPVVCSLTVGHLGKNELAAVSLASMTTNITFAIFEGIATSLDTLCPLTYGAGNYFGVGIHIQRCIAFSMVVFIPFAFLWWFSQHIFSILMPDEPVLVELTSQFLRISIFGAPAYIMFESLKRFLQAQGIFDAGIYVLLVCAPLNIFLSYTLVWNAHIGVGFIGAPIAVALNFWLMFLLLLLYAIYVDGYQCWGGFSKKALHHWKDLSHLAIPGIIMLEAEDLSYEILTLFSSYFGTSFLAAQSAVSTTVSLLYMIPFSVGISSSTRIANFVGAKRPSCANLASRIGICASLVVGLLNCAILNLNKERIANIYSKDEEVVKYIVELFPLVGLVEIFDALNAVSGSCLRGQGMQYIGSIVNLSVYYLFAIPFGAILGWYFDLKLFGLWIGIGLGMLIIGATQSYFVMFPNWKRIMDNAEKRQETDSGSDIDVYDESSTTSSGDEITPLLQSS